MKFVFMAAAFMVACMLIFIGASEAGRDRLAAFIIGVFAVGGCVLLALGLDAVVFHPAQIAVNQWQREHLEEIATENLDDEDSAQMKAEYNQWLCEAQHDKEYWGWWSAWPDEIMELKPIE